MTKNRDMPAMPIPDAAEHGGSLPASAIDKTGLNGMTKREEFAKAALHGLLSFYGDGQEWDVTAREAVACADALLVELGEEPDHG